MTEYKQRFIDNLAHENVRRSRLFWDMENFLNMQIAAKQKKNLPSTTSSARAGAFKIWYKLMDLAYMAAKILKCVQ